MSDPQYRRPEPSGWALGGIAQGLGHLGADAAGGDRDLRQTVVRVRDSRSSASDPSDRRRQAVTDSPVATAKPSMAAFRLSDTASATA